MDPERWKRIKSVFEEALELPDQRRSPFLDRSCDDPGIRREVESLLASHESSEGFLEGTGARELIAAIIADQPEEERIGQRFGPYRIVRRLGGGGMGAVFLATRDDGEFQRRVAIKIVRHGTLLPEAIRHFRHERQILADLDHPNIARLLDGGTTEEGVPFFLMEYIEGEPLTVYCNERQLGVDERLRLMAEVAAAVEFAHGRGVIHRDLKPGNILVTAEGTPKLLDFGVAKLLQTEGAGPDTTRTTLFPEAMTPRYASPEQLRGGRVTAASDVYSLGVLLYELLTGRRPYSLDGRSDGAMERRVCEVEPLAPSRRVLEQASPKAEGGPGDTEDRARARDTTSRELHARLRGDLDRVVLKALRKRPSERYATPAHLAEDLERALAGRPVSARANELAYRLRSRGRRLRPYAAAVAVVFLAMLLGYLAANRGDMSALPPMGDFQHVALVTTPANETYPRVSPDGTRVAYLSDIGGVKQVWLHVFGNSEEVPASAALPSTARDLAWGSGGLRLAFLWTEGGVVHAGTLTPGDREGFDSLGAVGPSQEERPTLVRWLDDGLYLLRKGILWRLDPDSGGMRRLTAEDFPHQMRHADVSRDGRVVLTTATEPALDLWISALDGSGLRPLVQGPEREEYPRFRGPDGRTILYVSNASDQVDIWELDPDSDDERVARTTSREVEEYIDASSDGQRIVFQRTESRADLHVLDLSTGREERLTADSRQDYRPIFLQDRRVMFQRGKPEAHLGEQYLDGEIHVEELDGLPEAGSATKVTEGFGATPSPNGRWVAVIRYPGGDAIHDFQLVVVDRETGAETPVCERHHPGMFRTFPFSFSHANVAWAPDGRALYFIAWTDDGGTEIERIDLATLAAGSSEHELAYAGEGRLVQDLRFSPAGERLAWVESPDLNGPYTAVVSADRGATVRRRPLGHDNLQLAGWLDATTLVMLGTMLEDDRRPEPLVWDTGSDSLRRLDLIEPGLVGGSSLDADRRTLYLTGQSNGIHDLYALELDSGELRRLTNNRITTTSYAGVTVLPDERLLYTSQSRNTDLWTLQVGR